jgi:hypothetical protein
VLLINLSKYRKSQQVKDTQQGLIAMVAD